MRVTVVYRVDKTFYLRGGRNPPSSGCAGRSAASLARRSAGWTGGASSGRLGAQRISAATGGSYRGCRCFWSSGRNRSYRVSLGAGRGR